MLKIIYRTWSVRYPLTISFLLLFCSLSFSQIINVNKSAVRDSLDRIKNDVPACFKGGDSLLFLFISNTFNLTDTIESSNKNEFFLTIITFMVDSAGYISELNFVEPETMHRPVPLIVQEEIKNVMSKMPPWNPSFKNGKPVSSLVVMPVSFKINHGKMTIFKSGSDHTKIKKKIFGPEKILIMIAAVAVIACIAFLNIF